MTTTAAASSSGALLRTPLYQFHLDHGAKMVDFAGWEMPILYRSIIDEHNQVRASGGLFDVSHMGRLRFSGRDARKFLDHICTRQIAGMEDGQCRYSLVCTERGGCHDDVLVYRLSEAEYLMVCNGANRQKIVEHINQVKSATGMVFSFSDETLTTAMVALQGPKVMNLISSFSREVPALKRYRFTEKNLLIAKVIISRTGYTGEDGVEIILPAKFASKALEMLLSSVGSMNADDAIIKPIGLGARDTLRMEAGMPLYGHEITEDLDPISAGLSFAVKLDKQDDFIGKASLQNIASSGVKQPLVGLALEGKRSARQGMKITKDGAEIGFVTSGCSSPTLGKPIAMAYVDAAHSTIGTKMQIDLGRAAADAEIVKLPFYKAQ